MFQAEVRHGFQQVETFQTTLQQFLLVLMMINEPFTLAKVLVGMRVVVLVVRQCRVHDRIGVTIPNARRTQQNWSAARDIAPIHWSSIASPMYRTRDNNEQGHDKLGSHQHSGPNISVARKLVNRAVLHFVGIVGSSTSAW